MAREHCGVPVSVVVPVKNGAQTIGACIEALLAQSHPRELTEILIVDNGSTDATREIVSRYPVTLLSETAIATSYAARNRGIVEARGEIIALTDADCFPAPDWIAQLLPPFDDPAVGAVAGSVGAASAITLCEQFTERVQPFARPQLGGLATLLTVNAAIRKSALEAAGLFDECLPTGGDVDLGWRLQRLGMRIADAPRAQVQHRHRTSFAAAFAQYRRYGRAEALLAMLYGRPLRPFAPQLRAMTTYIAGLLYRCCASIFREGSRAYRWWPLFLLAIEGGNVLGRLEGLVLTRGCRRNPYPNARLGRGVGGRRGAGWWELVGEE